jgi:hypothetical protein
MQNQELNEGEGPHWTVVPSKKKKKKKKKKEEEEEESGSQLYNQPTSHLV